MAGSELCPVPAFLNMIGLAPASDEDPAFGLEILDFRLVPLTYIQLQDKQGEIKKGISAL